MIFALKPVTFSMFQLCNTNPRKVGILNSHTHACISVHQENIINNHVFSDNLFLPTLKTFSDKKLVLHYVERLEKSPRKIMLLVQNGLGISKSVSTCKWLLTVLNKRDRMIENFTPFDHTLLSWLLEDNFDS